MTIKEIQTEIDETKADIGYFIKLYKTEHRPAVSFFHSIL